MTFAKRVYYRLQIARGRFVSPEPEFELIRRLLHRGDWAIDVGANVGHYAVEMARAVGPTGHIIALEPIPETFTFLTDNLESAGMRNVTLLNAAASSGARMASMRVPSRNGDGTKNYYQAYISDRNPEYQVCCVPLDALQIAHPIVLAKIDAEGHDNHVIAGMMGLIQRDRPVLIVESLEAETLHKLTLLGYLREQLPGSPNAILQARK